MRPILLLIVSLASISFSFYKSSDSPGVNRCLQDVVTALQYIQQHRRHALILDEILTEKKVEHIAFVRNPKVKAEKDVSEPVTEFMTKYLK